MNSKLWKVPAIYGLPYQWTQGLTFLLGFLWFHKTINKRIARYREWLVFPTQNALQIN